MPFLILLFLFVFVPVTEISLLINVGKTIGGFNTIAFVIFTAVLGAYLVRQQGIATIFNLQQEMNSGCIPAMQLAEGVALLFAGAVLLTPGFITDAIGFALLTPPLRRGLIRWVMQKGVIKASSKARGGVFNGGFNAHQTSHHPSNNKDSKIIEGEYREPK